MKTQASILVVDDEKIICESCQRILAKEKYHVDTDTNPVKGYQKALLNNYDLILLDLNMRDLDGMQFLSRLKNEKPAVPVIIITGFPTKETKEESKKFGVKNYILKPFKPDEILIPVKNILDSELSHELQKERQAGNNFAKKNYLFFKNAWLQQVSESTVRAGGLFPIFMNEPIKSIKVAGTDERIIRGFPLAQVAYSGDVYFLIPSPVSGKIINVNYKVIHDPSIFEDEKSRDNWLVTIKPDNPERDLQQCEPRNVFILSRDTSNKNKHHDQLANLGYNTELVSDAGEIIKNPESEKIILMDAVSFGEPGPGIVEKINISQPDAKIIVVNKTDKKSENRYRVQKIYCYAVEPVSGKEISSILFGAFCFNKKGENIESPITSHLPLTIEEIRITNRHGRRVTLLSYDNLLQSNRGVGYILVNKLKEKLFPLEIGHSKVIHNYFSSSSEIKLNHDKPHSDKIIILYKNDTGSIPGYIVRNTEFFNNETGKNNPLIRMGIQTFPGENDSITDVGTMSALAELIELEMISE